MKKFLSIFALFMAIILSVSVFVACTPTNDANTTTTNNNGEENKVTVTWYYGSKVLKEEKVEKGSTLTSWEPTEEGKTFTGWYSEASATTPFDFTSVINEDTDIFAAFKSDEHVEDTNEYYLIGTGSGDLSASGFDHAASAENLLMIKEENDKANIYTITVKMYAGDRFQICYGGGWTGQFGIGGFKGAEYCDGVNLYDNTEYTAADKKVAQVKDADGNAVFVGSDEYNNAFTNWNAILNEGHDGIYKITLVTYPNSPAYNYIEFELVEELEPLTVTHEMFFIGTFNEWSTTYENDDFKLAQSEDKATWTGFITITEDMYADWTETDPANTTGVKCAAVKLYNTIDGGYYGDSSGNNIFLTAGTYCFKYTVAGNVVEYQKLEYYVVGTLLDAEGNAVNYAVKEGVSPALTVDGNTASVEFVAYDATGNSEYSWMVDQGKPGVISIKVVYGCELGIKDWYSAEGGDNWYLPLGTYTVTLDIAAGAATVTAK